MTQEQRMPTTAADVPPELVVDFDVYDPKHTVPVDKMRENVAELAAKGPIVWSTAHGGHWVVTHYREVQDILRKPETFSSYPNNLVNAAAGRFMPLEIDPPDHTAYRRALQPLFSPARMRKLEEDIRRIVTELIDDFGPKGKAEYVSQFAHELPSQVFLALMGWPKDDAPMFAEAADIALNGRPGDTPEQANQSRMESALQMYAYFVNVINERREKLDAGEPPSDITGEIMVQELDLEDGRRALNDEELGRSFFLLLMGGMHTVQGSLAWGLMHLAQNPEQRQLLIDDPGKVPAAVEEILRMEAQVSMGRRATEDVQVADVQVKADDQMLLMLCSANHDTAEFEAPEAFDVARSPNRHLTFGSGPHRCVGSHLGRLELRIAIEELNKRIPDYRMDPEDPPVVLPSQVRSVNKLPIVFTPTS
jgi:cytochrome P450